LQLDPFAQQRVEGVEELLADRVVVVASAEGLAGESESDVFVCVLVEMSAPELRAKRWLPRDR
jgi:hypothetical protein